MRHVIRQVQVAALVCCLGATASARTWAGADASTAGFGVHAGLSVLRVPLIGTLGIEGAAERTWQESYRLAVGATLRDLNLPLTKVDAFATVGAEYQNGAHLYAEGGLRGPLLGPAGWRAFMRANTAAQFGAGIGLELRF